MKLKKKYRFDNKRQIWRIIPTDTGKLIIEERHLEEKQVYFHCFDLDSGKKILSDFQLDDKFWVGIEAVRDDVIYFHKFAKPDMPKHRGIFAFDLMKKIFIWQNPELVFLFILQEKIFANKEKFEGRDYYAINPSTGEIIEDVGANYELINRLRDESIKEEKNKGYLFPESFEADSVADNRTNEFIKSLRNDFVISGKIEFIWKANLLMLSFHEANSKGTLNNLFKAVDLSKGKYILEEVINKETGLFLTDSFFVKDDLLFLLFGKARLEVYKIIY
ncbi:MAG TPA: DUF4905 domain-containing protein [Ignavibacteriaceae bacterium]|nr:DUF4905 domain-containing protein [Ignavibacteriaceae bacterium]